MSAADRRRDLIALALVALGGLLCIVAFLGMRTLGEQPIIAVAGHPAVRQADRLWRVAKAGIALISAGGIAMGWSFWRFHARRARVS